MNLFRNSVKNLYRHKSKFILFGLLYLLLIGATTVMAAIYFFSSSAAGAFRREYVGAVQIVRSPPRQEPIVVTDLTDLTNLMENISLPPDHYIRTKNEYLSFLDNPLVYDVRFVSFFFQHRQQSNDRGETIFIFYRGEIRAVNVEGVSRNLPPVMPEFGVVGYDLSQLHLTEMEFNIIEGRMFENDNEAVIFKKLEYHDLGEQGIIRPPVRFELGETIVFEQEGFHKEFTIVGIVEPLPLFNFNASRRMPLLLFTTFEAAEYFNVFLQFEGGQQFGDFFSPDSQRNAPALRILRGYDVAVLLYDYNDFEAFRAQLEYETNGELTAFLRNWHGIANIQEFINNTQSQSRMFITALSIMVVALTIISTVILTISRKHEIAVLRSVGSGKGRVISGFVIEGFIYILGLAAVAFTVAQVVFFNFILPWLHESVTVPLQISTQAILTNSLIFVFVGAVAVVAVALAISIAYIISFEPLKIFNKRD